MDISFRLAQPADLPELVRLLADDPLGAQREQASDPVLPSYQAAFDAITRDPNHELIVLCVNDAVAGMLQLTFLPHLTHKGSWRAQIEGVRVASRLRSQGLGGMFFEYAIERARARGCALVQLTTDKVRPDAKRFYEKLGFVASHEGMKLKLG